MLAAPAPAQPALGQPVLLNPVGVACMSSGFGMRGGRMHNGVDLPAPAGAWVRAAAPGRVAAIRRSGASGLVVELLHADGTRTRYAHLGGVTPELAGGRREVGLGARLGRVGRSGTTRGTHLHFEWVRDGRPVDPAAALGVKICS